MTATEAGTQQERSGTLGRATRGAGRLLRIAYALVFIAALPFALAQWAMHLDRVLRLPGYGSPVIGGVVVLLGTALMIAGIVALWSLGHGLPMSPFPPDRLVTAGIYRLLSDPIYVGAVILAVGAALVTRSGAALWVIVPTLTLAISAFVLGYERSATAQRYGGVATPLLRLPPYSDSQPTGWDRVSVYVLVFLPWLVLYEGVKMLGVPPDAVDSRSWWDIRIPLVPWAELVYAGTYPFVMLAPIAASRQRDLRRFAVRGLWATAVIVLFYLLVPIIAPAKAVTGAGFWDTLMRWERVHDRPVGAFPAFHVVWACLAASLYASTWPRWRSIAWGASVAIALSCVAVGMHAIADVGAGFAAYFLITRGSAIAQAARRGTERVANSWRELQVGPLRLLSHGVYAGLAASVGLSVDIALAGSSYRWWLAAITFGMVLGAALWGQALEGSSRLLRPYGYYGSVIGAIAIMVAAAQVGVDAWLLAAAYATGASFAQGAGRLRCLVQGCCHGRPAPPAIGIRYTHPRSRVTRFTEWTGVPLHPAPLYSMVWMLVVGLVLLRLWEGPVPLSFIAGTYFILTGLGRFVEEHYRGEPQTVSLAGLRLYQWLAIAFVIGGAAMTCVDTGPAPAPSGLYLGDVPVIFLVAAVCYVAYGIDIPGSSRRFSRLA